ncbi:DNA-processing protein DprA [Promicromonospora sp. MS192]|uniref:DNA-processing protein DprA n=1 Tax=Promicromonospora sp. MS192 TaxID=3412684 RepID=UPI003C2DC26D
MQRLLNALTAHAVLRTPTRIEREFAGRGLSSLASHFGELPAPAQAELRARAEELHGHGVDVITFLDDEYPKQLLNNGRPVAPILFIKGNAQLLHKPSIGMCGSRHATELGLKAAQACGEEAADNGVTVVSGYAAGVDTATHLAALSRNGSTVIVLAEGIDHFRVKKAYKGALDPSRTLVVSQFAPWQRWAAHAAMTRNRIIYGLGRALVVIEAGERGGTLAAGAGALKIGRPVLVLNFGVDTPPGNAMLLAEGGAPVDSRQNFGKRLLELANQEGPRQETLEI